MARCLWIVLLLLLVVPAHSFADPVAVGIFSFDQVLTPEGFASGNNVFNIANLTGSFALPIDFPVVDSLVFLSSTLTLVTDDGSSDTYNLGSLAEGNFQFEVSDSLLFSSATFSATLNQSVFQISDGGGPPTFTSFTAASTAISFQLLAQPGSTLTPGLELGALMVAEAPPASVPEPVSVLLITIGLVSLVAPSRMRSQMSSRPKCTNVP
jgi:hypothetical protein